MAGSRREGESQWNQSQHSGGAEVPQRVTKQGTEVELGTNRMPSSRWEVDDDARRYLVKTERLTSPKGRLGIQGTCQSNTEVGSIWSGGQRGWVKGAECSRNAIEKPVEHHPTSLYFPPNQQAAPILVGGRKQTDLPST